MREQEQNPQIPSTGSGRRTHHAPRTTLLTWLIRSAPVILYILPVAFLTVLFFYPLFEIFKLSFVPEGRLSLGSLEKLVSSSYYLKTLWFTIWQATVSMLLTVLLALPGAYIIARYDFLGKSVIQALTTIPFVLPTVVVATAFTALLGPRGWVNTALMGTLGLEEPLINLQFTIWIILLAHVFYNYTVVLRIVGGFWANLSPRVEEAAAVLGAGRWQVFREVTLPLLSPAITAASLLVFIFDFTSFGVILILGGPRYATLEVEIYRQAVNLFNLPVAAALSLAQIVFTFSLMWVYTRLQARTSVPLDLRARRQVQRAPATRREKWIVGGNVALMLGLLTTPLLALAARSFSESGGGWTLNFYRELFINRRGSIMFVPPIEAVRNSVGFAGATTLLALLLGLIAAYLLVRRRGWISSVLDPVFMLPLGTSAVTLGFGYIIALDQPPLNLRASPALIPLAHTLVAFPFVVRSVLPALRGIDPRLREAAAVLGAGPWRVWREIDLPIVGRALLVGAVFAFTVSMGEFGATIFIARPQVPTMPVAIFRFLGQPGALNYGQALAMSTLLMLVVGVGFLAIERFRVGGVGEF
ncbi:MAG: putative 2-aminoethylphosphonate transport system permease protein PhnU [Anaerolineales bacterium]|nr:putative 2-aminoethylphosphonate transport system permease protein PhnU [Anaerolineales bacterium]